MTSVDKKIGAESIFNGYMRDFRENNQVDYMVIECYPEMVKKQLNSIIDNISSQYNLIDAIVIHRVGKVFPTDTLVTISAKASHRSNAITATKEILEALKYQAPFWKKEVYQGQSNWVDKNTCDRIQS